MGCGCLGAIALATDDNYGIDHTVGSHRGGHRSGALGYDFDRVGGDEEGAHRTALRGMSITVPPPLAARRIAQARPFPSGQRVPERAAVALNGYEGTGVISRQRKGHGVAVLLVLDDDLVLFS